MIFQLTSMGEQILSRYDGTIFKKETGIVIQSVSRVNKAQN